MNLYFLTPKPLKIHYTDLVFSITVILLNTIAILASIGFIVIPIGFNSPIATGIIKTLQKNAQNKKGVTITTLVITIIILLILAGVSISILSGPNGLIEKVKLAAKNTEIAEIKEKVELKFFKTTKCQVSFYFS